MNKHYTELMRQVSRTMEITAEKAMDENNKKGDSKGYETAKEMRDKYSAISLNFLMEEYAPSKEDFLNLYIASHIVVETLKARIKKEQAALIGYTNDLMPKLKEAADNPENADSIFLLEEEKS